MDLSKVRKNKQRQAPDINTLVYGKVPPQAKDLEEAVLGAIMLEKGAFEAAHEYLKPEMFYVDAHQRIFRSMIRLQTKNFPIDIFTVVEELRSSDELEAVGGAYYVTKLTNSVTSSAHIEAHSRIVVQKFIQREMIRISSETLGDAYEDSTDAFELLLSLETKIGNIGKQNIRGNQIAAADMAVGVVNRVNSLVDNPGTITGVTTGYKTLDKITSGLQPQDLIIIAARPSVGKTAFALNLARNAATAESPVPVMIFSLEMSSGAIANRIIAAQGEIKLEMISTGAHMDNPINYTRFIKASDEFASLPIYVDDTPGLNILEFKSIVRRMHRKHGLGLVIVDYLQLMSGKTDNDIRLREQEISNISRSLKATAKELNIPVVALSQLSRAMEKEKREPNLSDLRESGAIEQDADLVGFLYRPTYQNQEAEKDEALKHDATLKIAKHRNGKLEKVPFRIDLSVQRFYDADFDISYRSSGSSQLLSNQEDLPF